MKLQNLVIMVALLSAPVLAQSQPQSADMESQVAKCLVCHKGKLAFTGKKHEQVLEGIYRIRKGEKPHPPGLGDFEEAQLNAVAALLTGSPYPTEP